MVRTLVEESVLIPVPGGHIGADLRVPQKARGIVLFAHGSGSSRLSGRNRAVAEHLQEAGFATLLIDLLTHAEESVDVYTREFRFDIELLGRRVVLATDWTQQRPVLQPLPVGFFGASTGAAAASSGPPSGLMSHGRSYHGAAVRIWSRTRCRRSTRRRY
jgi:putative phosphoribosyl transferase